MLPQGTGPPTPRSCCSLEIVSKVWKSLILFVVTVGKNAAGPSTAAGAHLPCCRAGSESAGLRRLRPYLNQPRSLPQMEHPGIFQQVTGPSALPYFILGNLEVQRGEVTGQGPGEFSDVHPSPSSPAAWPVMNGNQASELPGSMVPIDQLHPGQKTRKMREGEFQQVQWTHKPCSSHETFLA